ncbi:MAG TPA: energy transducer TonB [Parafilimonas sp.]|nr:energy transducer TonB [Parafilimonas sp.]
MEANKILSSDFLDILFEGRNKEYGAYELRKAYNKRMIRAIIIMLAICLIISIITVVAKTVGSHAPPKMNVQDVQLENIKQPKETPPPPPPPPPKEPPKVEVTKFTPPKIVKDEEVKPEEKPPEQEKLEDTKIGAFNQEGDKSDVVAPPVEEKGTGQVAAPKTDNQDYDKEFTSVQVEAKFPGGPDAWRKYLERNLNNQTPADNGAAPGNYTVTVSFLVDKNGNISQVQALNDPGYGCAAEAVRVIQKGPKWTPAIQNGRNVIYRQKQNITFQVTDQ